MSWPNSPGYILESKAALADATWVPVSVAPVLSNGVNTVTLPMSQATAFFRLRK